MTVPLWLLWAASCALSLLLGLRLGVKGTAWALKAAMSAEEWRAFKAFVNRAADK